jgi:putative ABC transport system permease protein
MLKNYFKIAVRNIARKKLYTAINILGLALGICSCIVIYTIADYEFSFDTFHPGNNRIYRVMGDVTENSGDKLHSARLPFAVSKNAQKEMTGLDAIAGIIPYDSRVSITGSDRPAKHFDSRAAGSNFVTTGIVQPAYFSIFKYQWLAGDPSTALDAPLKVVLTQNKAQQYFGNIPLNEIIGKQVIYDDSVNATVSGIVQDWQNNTDLAFTDFISAATLQTSFLKSNINTDSWAEHYMNTWTFVMLSKETMPARLNGQMAALVRKHAQPADKLALWLQPLTDVHFDADVIENSIRTADKPMLYRLIAIAIFILTLAVINFINLSTAQSVQRAKEVGVRKVLGSSRNTLIFQFLAETTLLTFIAMALAVLLVRPVLAAFHSFIPGGVSFRFFEPTTILFLVFITIITALLAGLYPAKTLSSYAPVLMLKGSGEQRGGEKWLLRKGLIVFQFTVSLVFIIGSIVITRQLAYTREKNPGFSADAIINIDIPGGESPDKKGVLAEMIKQLPAVEKVALQWVPPMAGNGPGRYIKFNSGDVKETDVTQVAGNEDFIPLYEIKIIAGRNLVRADSIKEFVINENLSHLMGCKNASDAIGRMIYWDNKPYPVVGVVADFHTRSFHEIIKPLCIVNRPDREGTIAIKLASKGIPAGAIKTTLAQLAQLWKQVYPASTFTYKFYNETLALMYEKDQQTATLVNTAMAITIFISCIGLFGLALFTAEKRSKEISIRKILGASVSVIAIMLCKDFVKLVILSLIVASPLAWYFMQQWLQTFAYRINLGWQIFVLAGILAVVIALATISFQSIKAALLNPIKNLRNE